MSHDAGFKDENYQYYPNDANRFMYKFLMIGKNWYKNRFNIRNRYKEVCELFISIMGTVQKIDDIVSMKEENFKKQLAKKKKETDNE